MSRRPVLFFCGVGTDEIFWHIAIIKNIKDHNGSNHHKHGEAEPHHEAVDDYDNGDDDGDFLGLTYRADWIVGCSRSTTASHDELTVPLAATVYFEVLHRVGSLPWRRTATARSFGWHTLTAPVSVTNDDMSQSSGGTVLVRTVINRTTFLR
jgi:hypothetical protein